MKKILFSLTTLFLSNIAFSQAVHRSCGTAERVQKLYAEHPEIKQQQEELQKQINEKIALQQTQKNVRGTVYTIPVVVHVVHNGEAVGTGVNISDAQINSQITVLNKDFRKLNTDWSTKTPSVFQSLVADCELQFCLAKTTPAGTSTTGIDRINGGQASWSDVAIDNYRSTKIWDNTKYLNLWICKFNTSMGGILGYTTPVSLGFSANQDGIVFDYQYFGTIGTVSAPLDKGRTATHEIGHYFSLEHIWGDDNGACPNSGGTDDGVADTPPQGGENYGCPTFPSTSCSNGPNGDLFCNYMDYVDDGCMVMFTTGQKNRMIASNNAVRSALLNSKVCNPVGITEIKKADNNFDIFPNPATNFLYINSVEGIFSSDFEVKIYNFLGQEISSKIVVKKENESRYLLNTSALDNGNYILKIKNESTIYSKSISIVNN